MASKKSDKKIKLAAKRGLKDLPPKKTSDPKGGTLKKALIGNFPR